MPELEISGLSFRYAHATSATLAGVDLTVEQGEFVVLAGVSGSGKSTLLRAAAGLVPHFYGGEIAGEVIAAGISTRDSKPAQLAGSVASLFQDPESQVAMTTVDAELALGLRQLGAEPESVARAVEEVALALGISHLRGRSTESLSGGELQRVVLGSVLASRPRLALLDEPTSQLDPVAADELVALLRRLNEEHDLAVVVAEHRIDRWLPAADRVVALDAGRIVCDAAPADFLDWALTISPELATPVARMFSLAGIEPTPVGVKDARRALRRVGFELDSANGALPAPKQKRRSRRERGALAVEMQGVWHEIKSSRGSVRAILKGVDLGVRPGELVALVGRNGAGKSTLLRHLNGLALPTQGTVRIDGMNTRKVTQSALALSAALLLQCPTDYFLHDRVRDELPAGVAERALAAAGLNMHADAHPRDLSGGERQRLALAIVLAGRGWPDGEPPPVVALDEPTRGMDPIHRRQLAEMLTTAAAAGAAVVVATHDMDLVAEFATRVVVLGDGVPIADGTPDAVLAGGWYFTTEVAKTLGHTGAIRPEQGARLISSQATAGSAEQVDSVAAAAGIDNGAR